jgi:formate-dependent nitrite reductase membrane component NrfD
MIFVHVILGLTLLTLDASHPNSLMNHWVFKMFSRCLMMVTGMVMFTFLLYLMTMVCTCCRGRVTERNPEEWGKIFPQNIIIKGGL